MILAGVLAAAAALMLLAGRLPAHPQVPGDVRPADAQRHGVVDQDRQLGLGLIPGDASTGDLLQRLRRAQPSCTLPGVGGAAGARCR